MSSPATPKVSRSPTIPLVWIVPLLALAVGGWMVFREYRNRGPEITVDFLDGSGVEPRKTTLEHHGVAVGVVSGVKLKPDLSGVAVTIRLDKGATALAVEGSRFWIVNPEIGFSGVRGLDTLLTGARLNVIPGSGAPAVAFHGLEKPPPIENPTDGRAFVLQSDRLGSLSPGAPVFYREVKVGVVETSRLANDAASVLIRIRILTPYVDLVRTSTRFWNSGGLSFKMGLLGAELRSTSMESLFTGGVAFATPDKGDLGTPAPEGTLFRLHPEADKDWLRWQPAIAINPPSESPEPGAPTGRLCPVGDAVLGAAPRQPAPKASGR
jgi:paraquat-inducible protein B